MNKYIKFIEKDMGVYFHILGPAPENLATHLMEDFITYSQGRSLWTVHCFDQILHSFNKWLIQYNKSLQTPVLIGLCAIKKNHDKLFYVMGDSFFATIIKDSEIYFVGHQIMHYHQTIKSGKKEIIVPKTLLGGGDMKFNLLKDSIHDASMLIFSRDVDPLQLQSLFIESGQDFENFYQLVSDNNIAFLGWES